jgi:uncharacterized protein YjeT (DUF2065 family)
MNMQDLLAALCLVAVLEGLMLFAAPTAWQRMAEQLSRLPAELLRRVGAMVLAFGLVALWLVRH